MKRAFLLLCFVACSDAPNASVEIDVDVANETDVTEADGDDGVDEVEVAPDTAPDVPDVPYVCEPPPAGVPALASDAVPRPAERVGVPIVLDVSDLGLGPSVALASMAAHPSARRLYLGRYGSTGSSARDLMVVALDADDAVARTRFVSVATDRDPSVATNAQVIVVDAERAKLYVASTPILGGPTKSLAVLDLDADGEPIGAARTYDTGMPQGLVYALAQDPTRPRLFVGGYGDAQVYVVSLDDRGEPTGHAVLAIDQPSPVGGVGVADLVVSRDGRFLYVGGVDVLETYALEGDGARRVGSLALPAPPEGAYPYVRLALAGDRIGRRGGGFPPSPGPSAPYQSIALIDGVPTTVQVMARDLVDVVGGRDLFPVFELGYLDTLNGQRVVADLQLGVDGPIVRDRGGVMATAFGDGTPVVLTAYRYAVGSRQRDVKIRARIDAVDFEGVPLTDVTAALIPQFMVIGTDFYEAPQVTLGQMSDWVVLDRALVDKAYSVAGYISVAGAPTRVIVTAEVARGDTSLGTVTLASEGPDVLVRVPGLGLPDELLTANVSSERSVSQARAAYAATVGLTPAERPTLYPIGCYSIIGVQADRVALDALASTVASLGCNTILPISWTGLPDDFVRTTLNAHGITRRGGSTYTPPSYFDFEAELMSPASLSTWADEVIDYSLAEGSPVEALAHVTIADEPGWYYPMMLDVVRSDPAKLAFFHAFLEEQGLTPQDFEATTWAEVTPLGKPADLTTTTLAERKRIYWTLRFFPVAAARGLGLAADAMRLATGRDVPIHVNWNNWGNTAWHYNTWQTQIENNPTQLGPERGTGSVDWFETGRLGKQDLFSEDWLPDSYADLWSYRLDILRSAAMASPRAAQGVPMGSYVIPNASGQMLEGMSYKILSLLGRGGKVVELFNFGPTSLQSDGWSDNTVVYAPIARAMGRVAKAEHVMFDARPEHGRVAVLFPGESVYFDEWSETDYTFETEALHRALMHAGFRVDVLDAHGVATGQLTNADYDVLYIAGPNVPAAAMAQIEAWVAAGGTLVVTLGGAVVDEYDSANMTLTEVLGLAPRVRTRAPTDAPYTQRPALTTIDTVSGLGLELPIINTRVALEPTTADVIATFVDGSAAITSRMHGAGRAIAFGFYPGQQYEALMPRLMTGRLPEGDGDVARRLATFPAIEASAYSSARAGEMVEALRLDGPSGTAIVLLNWRNEARHCLEIVVDDVVGVPRSIEDRRVTTTPEGAGQRLVLERLDAVDILLFE